MSHRIRSHVWLGILPWLLGSAGCGSPAPADQLKTLSDAKKAQLVQFLESKQSKLDRYTATVTEETNVDNRGDHTHIGRIEFKYAVTKPDAKDKGWAIETAEAEYHFSSKEKKWVFKGCFPKGSTWASEQAGALFTFPELKAAFEQDPG
jgi:hypothetical protein